jgi:hypothetical protein
MINNIARCGNFTSSEIVALTTKDKSGKGFGKPALTYIQETNFERKLGRSLTDEVNARPLLWGKLLEERVFQLLGLEYTLTSKDTIVHPEIPFWAGSPDGGKYQPQKTVIDIKCPITLKSFCQLVDAAKAGGIDQVRKDHKDGEKYYWQLVSNAILMGCDHAELIVYMPYYSELQDIRTMCSMLPGDQIGKHYWIANALDDELPYLVDGGHYRNLNVIAFEVPAGDKKLLTDCVLRAGEMLIDPLGDSLSLTTATAEDENALKI